MKTLVLACLAVALTAPTATAAPGICLSVSDAAGDGRAGDLVAGVDLTSVRAVASPRGVDVTFSLAGAPEPRPGETYEYWFKMHDGVTGYELAGEVATAGLRAPTRPPYEMYYAPVSFAGDRLGDWKAVTITGAVDLARKTVTLSAPAKAFPRAPRAGHRWFVTEAVTLSGVLGTSQGPMDVAARDGHRLVAGDGRCRR